MGLIWGVQFVHVQANWWDWGCVLMGPFTQGCASLVPRIGFTLGLFQGCAFGTDLRLVMLAEERSVQLF